MAGLAPAMTLLSSPAARRAGKGIQTVGVSRAGFPSPPLRYGRE